MLFLCLCIAIVSHIYDQSQQDALLPWPYRDGHTSRLAISIVKLGHNLYTSNRLFTEKYNFLQASMNCLLFYLHKSVPKFSMWCWKSRTFLTNASESTYSHHLYFEIVNIKELDYIEIIARNPSVKSLIFHPSTWISRISKIVKFKICLTIFMS